MKKSIDYFEFKALSMEDKYRVITDRGIFVKKTRLKTTFKIHDYFAEVTYTKLSQSVKTIKVLYSFNLTE